jgi:hypothetical protein
MDAVETPKVPGSHKGIATRQHASIALLHRVISDRFPPTPCMRLYRRDNGQRVETQGHGAARGRRATIRKETERPCK